MFKNRAKKAVFRTETYAKFGFVLTTHKACYCPTCSHALNAEPDYQPNYCAECGQRISFEGVDWKEDIDVGVLGRRQAV